MKPHPLIPAALFASALTAPAAPALTWETKQLTAEFHGEGAGVGDFNKDGTLDVAYGPWWFAGPGYADGHRIYEPAKFDPRGYSKNFFVYGPDLNADGWDDDFLVLGFPGDESYWFENPKGGPADWKRHVALKVTENESPAWTDLTGDGKPEIVCSSGGFFGYATPGEDPTALWTFTPVSSNAAGGRFTHGLGIGDVNGDKRPDVLEKNGWWEQPADPRTQPVWTFHAVPFAPNGGAQMFAYDFDGDGDNDVFTSLAAHGYGIAWWEQTKGADGAVSFKQHVLMPTDPKAESKVPVYSQIHAIDLADINGDGVMDLVAGKRWWAHAPKADGTGGDGGVNDPAVLYWYEVKRGGTSGAAEFIPHEIHADSGVGTQVMIAELDGKAPPEIIVGNKKGAFVSKATAKP